MGACWFRRGLAVVILGVSAASSAMAQPVPAKSSAPHGIKIVVSDSPGSAIDLLARALAAEMAKSLKQAIDIENRPGVTSAYEYVAKRAPADGQTMALVQSSVLASLPVTIKELRFEPLTNLVPVIDLGEQRYVLVSPSSRPWRDFKDLVTRARANPGKLSYAWFNALGRLTTESLLRDAMLRVAHTRFKDAAETLKALVAAEVDLALISEAQALTGAGKLRVLATTGGKVDASFPKAPTLTELGIFNVSGPVYSLNVRSGAPQDMIEKLNAAAQSALRQATVATQLNNLKLEPIGNNPTAAAARLAQAARNFSLIARRAGIEPE